MKARKAGTYDGKDMYKGGDGSRWVKGKGGKLSKLGDDFDESKFSKAEKEGDEEDLEEEDEDDDEAEKSVSTEDLQKSIEALLRATSGGGDRKTELLQKAQGGHLDDAESAELIDLLGRRGGAEPLAKSVTDGLGGEAAQAAFDVAPFLAEQHEALTKSLGALADAVESQGQRGHELNLLIARAVADVGGLVKSMAEQNTASLEAISTRLGIIERQPVRAPKSMGLAGAQPMEKSFGGTAAGPGPYDGLTKSQVLNAMDSMAEEGVVALGGRNIAFAVSRFENGGQITRSELEEVKGYLKSKGNAAQPA